MIHSDKYFQKVKAFYPQYDYSNSVFSTLKEPITAICPKHGEFTKKHAFDLYYGRSGCPECGKETLSLKNKANAQERFAKAKQTNLQRMGVENPFQAEDVKKKIKKTQEEKYGGIGIKSTITKEKMFKTKEQRYGDKTYTNREKNNNTIKERYNVNNISELDYIQEKKKATTKKHFGVEYSFQSAECREKGKQTMLEKYNYENYGQSQTSRNYMKSDEFKQKRRATLHKNGTYGKSQAEDRCYNALLQKYPNAIQHYTSEKYPFECDMYVPELDLYIECNFFWTHGEHWFDKTNKSDLEKLEFWKSKNTKFYNIAIHVWTQSDLNKKLCAEENKLNYKVFWTEEEFNIWLSDLGGYNNDTK